MTRADKAARVGEVLAKLYPLPPIPLHHEDAFTLLVAVVLSAQCTDVRVNQVAPRLFARAKTPAAMARLAARDIEAIIRPCGLAPAKARHLRRLSEMLVERHGGQVPSTFEELEALPGVGHKTASVVMAQAFGQPAFPVDTHIHRLAARWGLSTGRSVVQTERDLKKLFAPAGWSTLHLQMIYFGREHCPARGHDLGRCPICAWAASQSRAAAERARGSGRAARHAHGAATKPARSTKRRTASGNRPDTGRATRNPRASVLRRRAAAARRRTA